jgi:hypothetical protein
VVEESEFHDRVDDPFDAGRSHQQRRGVAAADRRGDRQISLRDVPYMERPVLFRRLTDEPLAAPDHRAFGRRGEGIGREASETAASFGDVQRPHLRIEVGGEKSEHVVAEVVETLLAVGPDAEVHMPGTDPGLGLARSVVARHQHAGGADQAEQHERASPGDAGRQDHRIPPLFLALRQPARFLILHRRDQGAETLHRGAAAFDPDQ